MGVGKPSELEVRMVVFKDHGVKVKNHILENKGLGKRGGRTLRSLRRFNYKEPLW